MYGLNADDLRIRNTAATFAESLMPYEVDAELAGASCPPRSRPPTTTALSNSGCTPPTSPPQPVVWDALRYNRSWCRNRWAG